MYTSSSYIVQSGALSDRPGGCRRFSRRPNEPNTRVSRRRLMAVEAAILPRIGRATLPQLE
jgi:hypothetical protein